MMEVSCVWHSQGVGVSRPGKPVLRGDEAQMGDSVHASYPVRSEPVRE